MGALAADLLASLKFRSPELQEKIFKDECMKCFNTPFHPGGLFVCLNTFAGFCPRHIGEHCIKAGHKALLHIQSTYVEKPVKEGSDDKVTKLAIGLEGGFCSEPTAEVLTNNTFAIFPDLLSNFALKTLSGDLLAVCEKVVASDGAERAEQLSSGVTGWDGEVKLITKHANLDQLANGVKVETSGWKCAEPQCGLTENLWLNLTDGTIKCGRVQYVQDGEFSKGNNHMHHHYESTGYPLVVKLGTIEKGAADVFSYLEDESVTDPNLVQHLAHFGIDANAAKKTEKSTLEMELDMNQKWEYEICQEAGKTLKRAYGRGLTGMMNLGSSCYMNSSIQMLMQVPELVERFATNGSRFFEGLDPESAHNNINCQVAKVFMALESGEYAKEGCEQNGIKPKQFKKVIGRRHEEFSTGRQQDAEEYIRYFLTKLESNQAPGEASILDALRFKVETRLEDLVSKQVRYKHTENIILSLAIDAPIHGEAYVDEDGNSMRAVRSFDECLKKTFCADYIEDYKSPLTGESTGGALAYGIATFPDFLIVHMKKFDAFEGVVHKLDVYLTMPDIVDLESFKARGKKPEEVLLPPNTAEKNNVAPIIPSESTVQTLCSMGFSREASRRAAYMTYNDGITQASEWLLDHANDPDLNNEHPDLVAMSARKHAGSDSDESVGQLMAMGFSEHEAKYALSQNGNDTNMAAMWLLSNKDKVPKPVHAASHTSPNGNGEKERIYRDGAGKYKMIGFISHMGVSTHFGHYVAHIKKGEKWYLFNDEKVTQSMDPPIPFGYIYLYKRL